MFSGCYALKGLNLSHFGISSNNMNNNMNNNNNNEKGILINIKFISSDQQIIYTTNCYKTDDFSKIEEELFNKFPKLKSKNDVYYIACGNVINKFATLDQNRIGNGDVILINYID